MGEYLRLESHVIPPVYTVGKEIKIVLNITLNPNYNGKVKIKSVSGFFNFDITEASCGVPVKTKGVIERIDTILSPGMVLRIKIEGNADPPAVDTIKIRPVVDAVLLENGKPIRPIRELLGDYTIYREDLFNALYQKDAEITELSYKEKEKEKTIVKISRRKKLLYDLSRFIKDFVGRKEILEKIEDVDRGVIFLKGDVGVGKTAIAAKIASEKKVPCLLIGKKPREIASLPSGNQIISELVNQLNHYYPGINLFVDITDREKTLKSIREGLEKIYESLNEVPFIIIDGVDEAEDPNEIVRIVERIATKNAKILVTYKTDTIKDELIKRVTGTLEYDDIQVYYGDEFYLQADVNDKDIREYVEKN